MEELAAILHVTVAPSISTQPAHLHAYETAEAIKSSLLTRGIARSAIGGGSWSPLGAAELYMEGSFCWRSVSLIPR